MPSPPSPDRSARRAWLHPARRWAWVAALSILIHLLLLDALPRFVTAPAADEPVLMPLRARLMPEIVAAAPAPVPPTPVAPPPVAKKPPRPQRPKPVAAPRVPRTDEAFVPQGFSPIPELQVGTADPVRPDTAGGVAAASPTAPASPPPPAPAAAAPNGDSTPAPAPAPTQQPPKVTPPLSARLEYKALSQNVREANPIYGNGTITWSTADGRYRVALDATVKAIFIDVKLLASHSEGAIDGAGLAPDRYTEKTGLRSMLATNFNRDERQSVTFSASPASVPLAAGAQDRLSILFQIGGLLLADRSRAATGARIEVPVANVRNDIEHWTFTSFGPEVVDSGVGPVATIHLQRTPKPGSNDRTLDLWVADDGGYPARVQYTEPNGSTITMTLDRIGAVE